MQWQSLGEFFAMGGYAGYVWGSFGVAAAALGVESALLRARRQRALQAARRHEDLTP